MPAWGHGYFHFTGFVAKAKTMTAKRKNNGVAIYRAPFGIEPLKSVSIRDGDTIADIFKRFNSDLPIAIQGRTKAFIGGVPVYREAWRLTRIKPGHDVVFTYAMAGGGGDGEGGGGKQALQIVIAIATLVLSAGIASGAILPGLSASQRALVGLGVSLVGTLAQAALTAPPAVRQTDSPDRPDDKGSAAASGNIIQKDAPIPAVIGTTKVFPPFVTRPFIYRINGDEFVEIVMALAGRHLISDIKIGDVPIADAPDIEFETREGGGADIPLELVERYAITREPRVELSPHKVDENDQKKLFDQANPANSLPIFHGVKSGQSPDEIYLDLLLPEGLYKTTSASTVFVIPIRIKMTDTATDTTYNLPELHFGSNNPRETRPTVKLIWGDAAAIETVPANEGFIAAYKHAGGQLTPVITSDWDADSSFSDGAGNDGLYSGTEGTSNVLRVVLTEHEARIYIDAGSIPKSSYNIECKRGQTYQKTSFNYANYTLSSQSLDLFSYRDSSGDSIVFTSRANLAERLFLIRATSVYNSHPVKGGQIGPGVALIAIVAQNQQIEGVSCVASRYVGDWNGTDWTNITTTSIPAPHYRDILVGALAAKTLDETQVDDDSLVAWRAASVAAGDTCDMVAEDARVTDLLETIASTSFARPRQSETWGVIRDFDRSGDDPVQIFTARNSSGLSMSKAFDEIPDKLRVTYRDASLDYEDQEIEVERPGREDINRPLVESVRFDGITTQAKASARALFDLKQAELRGAFWSFEAAIESIICTRGDLIGINHDMIATPHGSARIVHVSRDTNGHINGVTLDEEITIFNEDDMLNVADMLLVADMKKVGLSTEIIVRHPDASQSTHAISNATGSAAVLNFTTPVVPDLGQDGIAHIRTGNLVAAGSTGNVQRRMIVFGVQPLDNYIARVVCVDEAPSLH